MPTSCNLATLPAWISFIWRQNLKAESPNVHKCFLAFQPQPAIGTHRAGELSPPAPKLIGSGHFPGICLDWVGPDPWTSPVPPLMRSIAISVSVCL